LIEINHLVKKYGEHVAVDDLTLTVEPGKIYGFLGPNGAGKSTTMNMITGYLGATSGEVKINGHDIFADPQEAKKCVGYLPEIPPLYTEMTVREYLDFVAELKGLDKKVRKTQTEEIMELTHTKEVSERLIRNLSKGYRQRVGFAQAIMGYPDVIILDEPTVGLDPKQIIEVRELMKELGKKHTVILSSHILSEVSAVCDYVLIISHGKLVASDTPENLGKLAEGSNTLNLIVKGEKDKICTALGQIEGVKNVTAADAKEEYAWNVTVSTNEDRDVREEVFFKMADVHCPILEMQSKKVSLEEIFLELTEDDKKSKTSEKKMEVNSAGEAEKILEAQNGETDKKEGEDK